MSDDDQEVRNKKFIEEYARRLSEGHPLFNLPIHEILGAYVAPTGELVVDFSMNQIGDPRQSVMRLVLSKESAQTLKHFLAIHENIPDTLPKGRDSQSTH